MMTKLDKLHRLLLHGLLIGLAAAVVLLAMENRSLRERLPAPPPTHLEVGTRLPAMPVLDLDGSPRSLDPAGERESLFFLFTTTCPACLAHQATWREVYERVGDRYEIIGVSLSALDATREYRERHELPFPVVVADDPRELAVTYQSFEVPMTVHVDRGGEVRQAWLGRLPDEALGRLRKTSGG